MKYYINTNKELFGVEQGQEFLIQSDWIECTLQEDGMPYSKYNTDGTPDLEAIQAETVASELSTKIAEAKAYLASTDFKMTVDYFATMTVEKQEEFTSLRKEAREFIRANQGASNGL